MPAGALRSKAASIFAGLPHPTPLLPPTAAGHEYDAPGVFATNPREAPGTVAWREAIPLGRTDLSPAEVHALVQQMGAQYKGNRCASCCLQLLHMLQRVLLVAPALGGRFVVG